MLRPRLPGSEHRLRASALSRQCRHGPDTARHLRISLCRIHHDEQHRLGADAFGDKYQIDLWALATEFARKSPDWEMRASQKEAERATSAATIAKTQALIPLLQQQFEVRETLFEHETGSKLLYLQAQQQLVEQQQELGLQKSTGAGRQPPRDRGDGVEPRHRLCRARSGSRDQDRDLQLHALRPVAREGAERFAGCCCRQGRSRGPE
jgi:hypothetical protein